MIMCNSVQFEAIYVPLQLHSLRPSVVSTSLLLQLARTTAAPDENDNPPETSPRFLDHRRQIFCSPISHPQHNRVTCYHRGLRRHAQHLVFWLFTLHPIHLSIMHLAPFRARPARVLGVLAVVLLVAIRLSDLLDISLHENIVAGYHKTHDVFTSTAPPAIDAPLTPASTTPRSRVAKVTIATNKLETDIIRRALQTHERHNTRHGYTQFTATRQAVGSLTENDRHKRPRGAWTKPAYLLSILVAELQKPDDERLEWVLYVSVAPLYSPPC